MIMQGLKVTIKEIQNRISISNPNFNFDKSVNYTLKGKINITCKKCKTVINKDVYQATKVTFVCTTCSAVQGTNISQTIFVKRVKTYNPNIIVLGSYINSSSRVSVQCKKCLTSWLEDPQKLMYKNRNKHGRCKNCRNLLRKSTKSYKEELTLKRPDLILLSEYKGCFIKVEVKSLICGHTFTGNPSYILHAKTGKSGCFNCVCKTVHIKSNQEDFTKNLFIKKPNLQILGNYINLKTKIKIKCLDCNYTFESPPNRLLALKYACVECARMNVGYKRTTITIKNKTFNTQGYENIFIQKLAKTYPEQFKDLLTGKDVPIFFYVGTSPTTKQIIKRSYRPDGFIPTRNLIVEVKSTYTAWGTKEWFINLKQKRKAVIAEGYNFALVLITKAGEHLKLPKNWYRMHYKTLKVNYKGL